MSEQDELIKRIFDLCYKLLEQGMSVRDVIGVLETIKLSIYVAEVVMKSNSREEEVYIV